MANLDKTRKYLNAKGVDYKVVDLGGAVFTVDHVAGIIEKRDEIVKTLPGREDFYGEGGY